MVSFTCTILCEYPTNHNEIWIPYKVCVSNQKTILILPKSFWIKEKIFVTYANGHSIAGSPTTGTCISDFDCSPNKQFGTTETLTTLLYAYLSSLKSKLRKLSELCFCESLRPPQVLGWVLESRKLISHFYSEKHGYCDSQMSPTINPLHQVVTIPPTTCRPFWHTQKDEFVPHILLYGPIIMVINFVFWGGYFVSSSPSTYCPQYLWHDLYAYWTTKYWLP